MEEQIIPEELNDLSIQEMIRKSLSKKGRVRSLWNGIFEKLFDTKILDPSNVLALSIELMKDVKDMLFIYICLKHIERVNFYVSLIEEGSFHILAYGVKKINPNLTNFFVHMMLMKGCDISMKTYNSSNQIQPPSLKAWFIGNDKFLPNDSQLRSLETLSEDERTIIEILFDLKDSYPNDDTKLIMVSRKSLFQKIQNPPRSLLKDSFYAIFKPFFIDVLNSGVIPTYLDICFFVTHYNRFRGIPSILPDLKEMIFEVIKRGVEIDEYIISEISTVDSAFSLSLREAYAKPLWLKISTCKTDGYIPKKLRDLSIFLGHSPEESKQVICSFFSELAESDTDVFISNYIQRNVSKLAMRVTPTTKRVPETVYIENSNSFENNPFEYPEIMMHFYKAEKDKIYAFSANQFDLLIRTEKYNQLKLPKTLIYELQNKVRFLEYCEISPLNLKPIGKLIQEFQKPEILSMNPKVITDILNILRENGFTKTTFLNTPIEDLKDKFRDMMINFGEYYSMPEGITKLSQLNISSEFIIMIFARIVSQKK